MSDSETLDNKKPKKEIKSESKDEDFPSMSMNLVKRVNYKISIFLFFIGIIIFSDFFIENFLPKNAVDGNCANTQGTMIQLMAFVIMYILVDLLAQGEVI
jgi:hypothetical protein